MNNTPNFIVIGTQKGGTTSLFEALREEKNIFIPDRKELQYFSINYSKGDEWYKDQFKDKKEEQQAGEITPFYLFHPKAAQRIYEYNKNIKLIVLLRNPIKRAISHYFHAKQRNFEDLEMLDAFKKEEKRIQSNGSYSLQKHSYIQRSKYINQLKRYHELFEDKQLLILKSEDMFKDMIQTKQIIGKFLGTTLSENAKTKKAVNSGRYEKEGISEEALEYLKKELWETKMGMEKIYGITW